MPFDWREVRVPSHPPSLPSLRIATLGFGWEIARDARRFPSTRLLPVLTCTRMPRRFGIFPSFKDHFLSPVPNLSVTIRTFLIAVRHDLKVLCCRERIAHRVCTHRSHSNAPPACAVGLASLCEGAGA
jgi:hypothetical protein